MALGKGVPQPWIPSVARPRDHDVIYEQDFYELDYEDVGVQTEPYDPYAQEDEESLKEEHKEEQKESNPLPLTATASTETTD